MATSEPWWDRRKDGERTFAYLGRVLDSLGADTLAQNARAAHYDDFECPRDLDDGMNIHRLIADVQRWASWPRRTKADRLRSKVLIAWAKKGEFDSTKEESDRYVASARGQADIAQLLDDINPKENP